MKTPGRTTVAGAALTIAAALPLLLPAAASGTAEPSTELVGRAVLPVMTFAPGPPSGAALAPAQNGVTFPVPSQPVEGFSSIIDGRRPGEYLAMPDNGFGGKASSGDFLIRAYWIRPDFKTAQGGSGTVAVEDYISFRDPHHVIGFRIVNEDTTARLLTGGDIDPESVQRAPNGDLWVGDEFGPWILHFSSRGVLLDRPYEIDVKSPNNPWLGTDAATQPNSGGFEAMAISPNGKYLYAVLEKAKVSDLDQSRRVVYEFSLCHKALTGRTWWYHTQDPSYMVSDAAALSNHRLVLIQRDGGRGETANFRDVEVVNLKRVGDDGFLTSRRVVDLTNIPDPNLISLPPLHDGDVRLGNPFGVACESVEAVHPLSGSRLLVGCDNNFPNSGRNPTLPDDNEFVVVHVNGINLGSHR
jgi:hypothetical protein